MEEVIKIIEDITQDFKPRDKEHIAEFLPVYEMIDQESWEEVKKAGIVISKNSQLIALTQDAKTIKQTLDLAEKMGFLDAYKENPKRLTVLVSNVIKRMAKCDAIGIPYKTDEGYANFLFSSRAFKEMTDSLSEEQKRIITTPSLETDAINTEAHQVIRAIIEKFDFTEDDIAKIYQELEKVEEETPDLSLKEKVLNTLKETCSVDINFLENIVSDTLEELGQNEGRKAA